MYQNPYSKYQEQSVMTMTHGDMLLKLYEGAVRQITLGIAAIETQDYSSANTALQKAQNIVAYLSSTLDKKYEVSAQLDSLYEYFNHVMLEANMKKDPSKLPEIIEMLNELKETFAQADRMVNQQKQPSAQGVRIG